MAEAAWEVYLEPPARRVYEASTDEEREELDRLFSLIELDPWADNAVKVTVDMPPAVSWSTVIPAGASPTSGRTGAASR